MNKFLKVCAMALVFAGAINEVEGLAPATLGTPVDSEQVECEATIKAEIDANFNGIKKKLVFFKDNKVTAEGERTLEFTVNSIGSRHKLFIVPTRGIVIQEGKMYLVQDGVAVKDAAPGQCLLLDLHLQDSNNEELALAAADNCFVQTEYYNGKNFGKWKLRFDVPAVEKMNHDQVIGDYKGSVKLSFLPTED